jgi:hypothetical protein
MFYSKGSLGKPMPGSSHFLGHWLADRVKSLTEFVGEAFFAHMTRSNCLLEDLVCRNRDLLSKYALEG